jgi:hypothetical protein
MEASRNKRKGAGKRIDDSFSDQDNDRLPTYIGWVITEVNNYSQSLQRGIALIFLLAAIFELLLTTKQFNITVGPFHFYRGSILVQFIPVAVSFLFFQIMADVRRLAYARATLRGAFTMWWPKAGENEMDDFIIRMPLALDPDAGRRSRMKEGSESVLFVISFTTLLAILFGTLAFNSYAYLVLFRSPLSRDIGWFISLGFATFFTITGLIYFFIDQFTGFEQ